MPYMTSIERKGRAEERLSAIMDVLDARFGEVSAGLQEKLREVSDQKRLRELHRFAVTVASLADFERGL